MEADFGRDFVETRKSSKPRTEYLTFKIYGQEPLSLRVWKSPVETPRT